MTGCARKALDTRACPKGAVRGIDVARMYPEIAKLVRAYAAQHARDVDPDDLVQEVALAIARKNDQPSCFDPSRSAFSHYTTLVARSIAGHMRASVAHRPQILPGEEALEAAGDAQLVAGELGALAPDARTVGSLLEHLDQVAGAAAAAANDVRRTDPADARYQDGIAAALRAVSQLLSTGFAEDAVLELVTPATSAPGLPERLRALLALVARPLLPPEIAAGLVVPLVDVEASVKALGAELLPVVLRRDGRRARAWELATPAARIKRTLHGALGRWRAAASARRKPTPQSAPARRPGPPPSGTRRRTSTALPRARPPPLSRAA